MQLKKKLSCNPCTKTSTNVHETEMSAGDTQVSTYAGALAAMLAGGDIGALKPVVQVHDCTVGGCAVIDVCDHTYVELLTDIAFDSHPLPDHVM